MAIVFALLSALTYGVSDFTAGLASRRMAAGIVATTTLALGVLTALVAVIVFPGDGLRAGALLWGALSGLGSALGTLSLYEGLAVARMSVVATLSAVLTAVIPVLVGVVLGNHLGPLAIAGIVLAVPAIGLVSASPSDEAPGGTGGEGAASVSADRAGLRYGCLAGAGFALLFIALDRAGTRSGAWPLVPGQLVSLTCLVPFGLRGLGGLAGLRGLRGVGEVGGVGGLGGAGRPSARTVVLLIVTGVLSATANLLYLAATGRGELAIVAVLSALYPAATVLLARVVLSERWSRPQIAGLAAAAIAIVLVTVR